MTNLRTFRLADRDDLIATINAVCAEGRWMSAPSFQPTPGWRHALREPTCSHHWLLVAEDQGRIVGWCRVLPTAYEGEVNEAELGIGLLSAYRNQGLGTTLVSRALDWAREAELHRVWLRTRKDNARARRVFTRCGFCPSSSSDGWIKMVYQLDGTAAQGGGTRD